MTQFSKERGKDKIKEHLIAYNIQNEKPSVQDFFWEYTTFVKSVNHLGNQLSQHSTNIC